jgi:hypothetical protein
MSMELGGAVRMINARKSLILDEELSEPGMDFASTKLEGVWWLPSRKAELRLALTNVTNSPLATTVTVDQYLPKIVTLGSHETRIINLSKGEGDFDGSSLNKVGGISISHSGHNGALLARGFVTDANLGYSQVIELKDPGVAKSSVLNGAGLRLGKLNGKDLHPVMVARNTGTSPTVVTGRIWYTAEDSPVATLTLPPTNLTAGETSLVDVESATKSISFLPNLICGIEFEYTTAPGSVSITAQTISSDDNQVYRVSVIDAAAQMSSTGRYPWNLNSGATTVIYLKNVTDDQQSFYLYANYQGGFWILGVKTIEPHQTITLDMRQVKERQLQDEKGNILPADANDGQIFWSGRGTKNLVLIGRVEQIEAGGGMSFTTACGTCCFPQFSYPQLLPGPTKVVVGDTTQFRAYEQDSDCYGIPYPSLTPASGIVSWSTTNSSVATVSGGLASAVGPGAATIRANWSANNWDYQVTGPCDPETGICGGMDHGGGGGQCTYDPIPTSAESNYTVTPVPDHLVSLADVSGYTTQTPTGTCATQYYLRQVVFQLVSSDATGAVPVGYVNTKENYDSVTTNSCPTGQPQPDNTCAPTNYGPGQFIETMSTSCGSASGPANCGYDIQWTWFWCGNNTHSQAPLAALNATVHRDEVVFCGRSSLSDPPWPNGSAFRP